MLAPTAVEEVAGAAVGETMATVTPETMAEFSSALSLLSISYFYLVGNNLVTSVASRDILPRDAALADLPTVSTA
jgi:hypothetical protein